MIDEKIERFSDLCEKSVLGETLKNIVLSSPRMGEASKIKGVLKTVSGKLSYSLNTAFPKGEYGRKTFRHSR